MLKKTLFVWRAAAAPPRQLFPWSERAAQVQGHRCHCPDDGEEMDPYEDWPDENEQRAEDDKEDVGDVNAGDPASDDPPSDRVIPA